MSKTAIITGICGQDGAYLAKLLIDKGYKVIGTTRDLSTKNDIGLHYLGIDKDIELIELNKFTVQTISKLISDKRPNEVYNLAAQSSVGQSFLHPYETIEENIGSVLSWMEAIKLNDLSIRFYQASSSEMYGNVRPTDLPIQEGLVFNPASPYGISKASAHWIVANYREAFGVKAACGILFNHESALRGPHYVIKKIIHQAILISQGLQKEPIQLGNIDIERDWGYAPHYVDAMWRILQQAHFEDYHICSGTLTSLKSFIELVLKKLNLDFEKHIVISSKLYRPVDLQSIYGDNSKAKEKLGWVYDLNADQLIDQLLKDELNYMQWISEN